MSGVLENSREALGLEWSEPAEERAPKRWRAKLCEHHGPSWGWSCLTATEVGSFGTVLSLGVVYSMNYIYKGQPQTQGLSEII